MIPMYMGFPCTCIPITNFFRDNLVILLMPKLKEVLNFMKITRQVVDCSVGKLNFFTVVVHRGKECQGDMEFHSEVLS